MTSAASATPGDAAGRDRVLVGRIRRAALNAVQIAELLLARAPLAA